MNEVDEFDRDVKSILRRHSADELPYTVFQRKDSPNYWMRFSIKGHGQQRIGLGTTELSEAHDIAQNKYQEAIIKAEHGILEGRASFDRLAGEYVDSLYKEAVAKPNRISNTKYAKRICGRYLKGFFGNKPVRSIKEPKLYAYLEWRKSYWINGPGKDVHFIEYERGYKTLRRPAIHTEPSLNTLKREANVIRGILKFAVRKGYLTTAEVPKLELGKGIKKKRPAFTRDQFSKLLQVNEQRLMEAAKDPQLRYQRYLLHQFMIIAVETGMRTKELFNLNWGHIEGLRERLNRPIGEKQDIYILAYGKAKEPQRMVPTDEAFGAFEYLWTAQTSLHDKEPDDDDPVFVGYNGKRLGSLKKVLNGLLEAANLKIDTSGRVYSAYSFRHSYATWQLQKDPPMDIYTLAINMRTSVKMIEDYYSDVIPADRERALRGR